MTKKHRIAIVLVAIIIAFLLAGFILQTIFGAVFSLLFSNDDEKPAETAVISTNMFDILEKSMIEQLDLPGNISASLDAQIEAEAENFDTYFEQNYSSYLSLDSVEYGYFTNSNYLEALAIFSVTSSSHAEGLGRKIMAIYDISSNKITMQRTFSADEISLYTLSSPAVNYSLMLCTSTFAYSGNMYGSIEFGSLNGGIWSDLSVPLDDSNQNVNYSYDEISQTLTASIIEITAVDDYTEEQETTEEIVFVFDAETLQFIEVE